DVARRAAHGTVDVYAGDRGGRPVAAAFGRFGVAEKQPVDAAFLDETDVLGVVAEFVGNFSEQNRGVPADSLSERTPDDLGPARAPARGGRPAGVSQRAPSSIRPQQ